MVKSVSIGVIGIQGAVSEHIAMMKQACSEKAVQCNVSAVKDKERIMDLSGVILPGGESTTISRFLQKHGLADEVRMRVSNGSLAIMGTCAGCVLLGKRIVDDESDVCPLQLMDIDVHRNAFGRQRESFEQNVFVSGWKQPFPAVFIRAPIISKASKSCNVLAQLNSDIVMVEQNHMLAVSFHPELTSDTRIHQYFLSHILSLV